MCVDELVRVLVEPRNALIRQYEKLFELERVKLTFSDDAVVAVAEHAIKQETGARGLRAILERVMLDIMFDLPSRKGVHECVMTLGVISNGEEPLLVYEQDRDDEEAGPSSALG